MSDLAAYFATESTRTGDTTVTSRIALHPGIADAGGAMRAGAVAFAVDMCTGLALGLAVVDRGLWVVTTDLDVDLVAPLVAGPLRIEAEVVRASATTAVSTFTLHDDGTDQSIGGGTCTGRPFPFEFDHDMLHVPIGATRRHGDAGSASHEPLVRHLGFRIGEDATVEVAADEWLRNPWGILHGGVTACLADVAAEHAASLALGGQGRVTGELVRYLAPVRVGPARAAPRVLAIADGRALVEVRVTDVGRADRLAAVATLTVG